MFSSDGGSTVRPILGLKSCAAWAIHLSVRLIENKTLSLDAEQKEWMSEVMEKDHVVPFSLVQSGGGIGVKKRYAP